MNHSSKSRSRSPINHSWSSVITFPNSPPLLSATATEEESVAPVTRTRSARQRQQEFRRDGLSRLTRTRTHLRRSPRFIAPVVASNTMSCDVVGNSSAMLLGAEKSDSINNVNSEDHSINGMFSGAITSTSSATLNTADDCAICRDRKVNESYLLPCMHTYCYQCILQWVRINPTCPLCKGLVEKIIHSINSDKDFRESSIQSLPRGVFNLMSPIVNLFSTHLNRSSLSPSQDSDTNLYTEPRSTLLMALVVRALRSSAINPYLLRRLVYVNRLYTYPAPLPAHSNTIGTFSCLSRCTSRSFLSENEALQTRLIDFTQKELFYLAPWVDYMHPNRRNTVLQPLGSGNSNPSEALGRLSVGIVRRIASHLVPLNRVDDFADAIRAMDDRMQGGDGLLESVSTSALKHFSWELFQFARFSGTLEEYYSQSRLYANHFTGGHMRLGHSPPMHTAVYTSPHIGGSEARGFGNSLEGVSKETAQWLFRHLFNAPRSPFMSFNAQPEENVIRIACRRLQCSASLNPSWLVSSNDSVYHLRRHGIRGLLARMAEHAWSSDVSQMGLCELLDQARIGSIMEKLTHHGRHLVLRRIANLISFFSQPTYAVCLNIPLPSVQSTHSETAQVSEHSSTPQAPSLGEPNEITIALADDNSEVEGDDEAIIVSDSEESSEQQSSSSRSSIPRCCVEHKKHCCCCYRRRSADHMSSAEFAQMFKAFIEFYERQRKRQRPYRQVLNRPSSPIVISDDDDDGVEEVEPQPGPSRPRRTELPQQPTPPERPQLATEEETTQNCNSDSAPTDFSTVIDRPTTANEFYSLLNQAMGCDIKTDRGIDITPEPQTISPAESIVKLEDEVPRPTRPSSTL